MGSGPKYPDPEETAAAQTGQNIGTAVANTMLGNANQYSPYGSVTYKQTGVNQWTDPLEGKTYDLPKYDVTTKLSPDQKRLFKLGQTAQTNLAILGRDQSDRLGSLLAKPFRLDDAPGVGRLSYNQYGNVETPNLAGFDNIRAGMPETSIRANTGQIQGPAETNIRANPNQIQGPAATRMATMAGDVMDPAAMKMKPMTGRLTETYGTDFDAARSQVQDALLARLMPSLNEDRESLAASLAAQGIGLGTEAYDRAMAGFGQNLNDARMSAILAGGEEQSRLAGLERDRSVFENQAQGQRFGQTLTAKQFTNDAVRQANEAVAQRYGQTLGAKQFRNEAAQQADAAEAQKFGQRLTSKQFANDAARQANEAEAQKFGQTLTSKQFANTAAQQKFENRMQQTAGTNAVRQQRYGNQTDLIGRKNDVRERQYSGDVDARNRYLTEAYQARNQPINEIASLMSGNNVQNPTFQPFSSGQVANVDYAGLTDAKYQADSARYNDRMGGLFGLLSSGITAFPR